MMVLVCIDLGSNYSKSVLFFPSKIGDFSEVSLACIKDTRNFSVDNLAMKGISHFTSCLDLVYVRI